MDSQLEEFRKQKAEREKKASQNSTAQPVDNTVADSDGEVAAAASISNGPLSQSPETSFNLTQSKSSSSSSKRDESVGTSSSLELRGSSNDFTVNIRRPEALIPDSNRDKQLSESDGFTKGASFAGSTLLSTSTQMHGSGLISSRKGIFWWSICTLFLKGNCSLRSFVVVARLSTTYYSGKWWT